MFSNIHEAWNKDPVKEMTSRLNSGEFKNEDDFTNVFKFKDHNNNINTQNSFATHKPTQIGDTDINTVSLKLSDLNVPSKKNLGLSSDNALSLSTYTGPSARKSSKMTNYDFLNSDEHSVFDSVSQSPYFDTKCSYSIKHLKKCGKCYRALLKVIEKKIKKRIDDVVIDLKFKQIQSQHLNATTQPSNTNFNMTDSWKETLIIVLGAIITMFLIFLIVRSIWR